MDEIDKLINVLEEKEKSSFDEMELLLDSVDNLIEPFYNNFNININLNRDE